jgi:hypothetical protein
LRFAKGLQPQVGRQVTIVVLSYWQQMKSSNCLGDNTNWAPTLHVASNTDNHTSSNTHTNTTMQLQPDQPLGTQQLQKLQSEFQNHPYSLQAPSNRCCI